MLADMISTRPKPLTFCARIWLTYLLLWTRLPAPVVWLKIVWSIGATGSLSLIGQLPVKLHIVSGNGEDDITLTVRKTRVTVP